MFQLSGEKCDQTDEGIDDVYDDAVREDRSFQKVNNNPPPLTPSLEQFTSASLQMCTHIHTYTTAVQCRAVDMMELLSRE